MDHTGEDMRAGEDIVATSDKGRVDTTVATLRSKLTKLQAKLHKEFRWYCDTILQGGALAVRISYKIHCAVETIEMVDRAEVRDDPALGEPMVYIGESLYTEADIDALLEREYLLDEVYDTWCSMQHDDGEWSDTLSSVLDRDN